jgi:hypothetical protein
MGATDFLIVFIYTLEKMKLYAVPIYRSDIKFKQDCIHKENNILFPVCLKK